MSDTTRDEQIDRDYTAWIDPVTIMPGNPSIDEAFRAGWLAGYKHGSCEFERLAKEFLKEKTR